LQAPQSITQAKACKRLCLPNRTDTTSQTTNKPRQTEGQLVTPKVLFNSSFIACSASITKSYVVGVGVDRPVWETIRQLKAGETYEHTITKSELYRGKVVTYHAPFDKCDRVEDYKVAWEHFSKQFAVDS
jgi:hypothetical protein